MNQEVGRNFGHYRQAGLD